MDTLVIGEVLKPQGLKGEVKIRPTTDDPARFTLLKSVYMDGKQVAMDVRRVHDGFVYAVFADMRSREEAEKLRGRLLHIPREEALPLAEGSHYIVDLIGLAVFTDVGEELGVIREIIQPGANDVYILRGPRGEVLLPALNRLVADVDIEARRMVVRADILGEVAVFED